MINKHFKLSIMLQCMGNCQKLIHNSNKIFQMYFTQREKLLFSGTLGRVSSVGLVCESG